MAPVTMLLDLQTCSDDFYITEGTYFEKKILKFFGSKFFSNENFYNFINFFAKVGYEYQNMFPHRHCRSVRLIVLSQDPSQKQHFNVGHPVIGAV